MDQLRTLSVFFDAIAGDPRISVTHIGLYAALIRYRQQHDFSNPIHAFSYEIMELAKIGDGTYRKCLKDLSNYGYIRYVPSFNNKQGSTIYFLDEVGFEKAQRYEWACCS